MMKWQQYAKFVVAITDAMLITASQVFTSGTAREWITIALAGVGAAGVYLVPNQGLATTNVPRP